MNNRDKKPEPQLTPVTTYPQACIIYRDRHASVVFAAADMKLFQSIVCVVDRLSKPCPVFQESWISSPPLLAKDMISHGISSMHFAKPRDELFGSGWTLFGKLCGLFRAPSQHVQFIATPGIVLRGVVIDSFWWGHVFVFIRWRFLRKKSDLKCKVRFETTLLRAWMTKKKCRENCILVHKKAAVGLHWNELRVGVESNVKDRDGHVVGTVWFDPKSGRWKERWSLASDVEKPIRYNRQKLWGTERA